MNSDDCLACPADEAGGKGKQTVPDWHVSRTEWKPIAYSSPVVPAPAHGQENSTNVPAPAADAPVYATPPTTPPATSDAEPPYDVRTPMGNKAEPGVGAWLDRDAQPQAASIAEAFSGTMKLGAFPFSLSAQMHTHKRQPSQPETPSEASDDCADSVWSVQSVRGSPAPPAARFGGDTPGADSSGNGNGKRPDPVEMMMFKKGVEKVQRAERAQARAPAPASQWPDIEDEYMASESEDGARKGVLGRSYTD